LPALANGQDAISSWNASPCNSPSNKKASWP
jgi:hypothetical protein